MEGMTDIGRRVKAAREQRGWDQPELARRATKYAGKVISKQTISKIESSENPTRNPSRATLEGIAGAFNASVEWVLSGHVREGSAPYLPDVTVSAGETPPGYVRLELLTTEGSMGDGAHNSDYPEVLRHIDVAEAWARTRLPRDLSRIRIITGRGDSNAPLINDGDILFVDSGIDHFAGEGMYLFNWMGHMLCKRLAPNLATGRLEIQSVNKSYETTEVPASEISQLNIVGKVVAWWTLRTH